jgi:hypothetical protein
MTKLPDKIILEIADILFFNPEKKMSEVLTYFVERCQKNSRTVNRYIKKAKDYNQTRLEKQAEVKEKAIIKTAEKQAERQAMTRDEAMQILEQIAIGKAKKLPTKSKKKGNEEEVTEYEIIYPADRDRISAISKLSDMQGWNAPTKTQIEGNLMPINIEVIDIRTLEIVQELFGT